MAPCFSSNSFPLSNSSFMVATDYVIQHGAFMVESRPLPLHMKISLQRTDEMRLSECFLPFRFDSSFSVCVDFFLFFFFALFYASSCHDSSTISLTRRLYSRRFSLYRRLASEFAGDAGFGSYSRDWILVSMADIS